jgi:hypothetical protein
MALKLLTSSLAIFFNLLLEYLLFEPLLNLESLPDIFEMNEHEISNLLGLLLLETIKNLPVKFNDTLVILQTKVEPFEGL